MVEALKHYNENLHDIVQTLQSQTGRDNAFEEEPLDFNSLAESVWDDAMSENFKSPPFTFFDGKSDPQEHIIFVNSQMAMVGASGSLKCKLMTGTFKDIVLRWYMSLSRSSFIGYQDLTRNMVQNFAAIKHRKVSTTSLFKVCQGPSESMWEYMAQFNEETIKISHLNQEMFVGAFQNSMRAGHFNESLAQKPTSNMDEVINRVECDIKGEESNMDK